MDREQLNALIGLTEDEMDAIGREYESDAWDAAALGVPRPGRPALHGSSMRSVTFKEDEPTIAAMGVRPCLSPRRPLVERQGALGGVGHPVLRLRCLLRNNAQRGPRGSREAIARQSVRQRAPTRREAAFTMPKQTRAQGGHCNAARARVY